MKYHGFTYLFIALFSLVALVVAFVLGVELGISSGSEKYDRDILPALSVIGVWAGVLATFSAVVISLWLAFRQIDADREVLDCRVNMVLMPGVQEGKCIGVHIVSKGNRPANISSVSWVSEGAKAAMWVARYHEFSHHLPRVLAYGEQLSLIHEVGFENHIYEYIVEHGAGEFENLYLLISTTTMTKKVKVDKALMSMIKAIGANNAMHATSA